MAATNKSLRQNAANEQVASGDDLRFQKNFRFIPISRPRITVAAGLDSRFDPTGPSRATKTQTPDKRYAVNKTA